MELKDKKYFYFTQNSLNTFKTCPFKFKKKYIDNIKWQDEENVNATEHAEFGNDFHKIAQRYFMGVSIFEESFLDNKELLERLGQTNALNFKEKQETVKEIEKTIDNE